MRKIILSLIMTVCALLSGAQTLTRTYVEYADSADRYIRNENWVDAERMIVNALRLEPANKSNYLLWSNLGIVRDRIGNTEGALQAFDIGLASAPRSTVLLANRAYTLMKTGRDKEALRDLDLALELDSTLLVPRLSRAGLHLNLVLATVASAVMWLCAHPLIGAFTTDGSVIAAAMLFVVPLVLYQYLDAVQLTLINAIRGTSQVKPLLWIALISYIMVGVPVLLLFAKVLDWEGVGVYYSFDFALLVAAILAAIAFRRTRIETPIISKT